MAEVNVPINLNPNGTPEDEVNPDLDYNSYRRTGLGRAGRDIF